MVHLNALGIYIYIITKCISSVIVMMVVVNIICLVVVCACMRYCMSVFGGKRLCYLTYFHVVVIGINTKTERDVAPW